MTQHIIKLGEGYGDVYELITLINSMPDRVQHLLVLHTTKDDQDKISFAAIMKPTSQAHFLPIYVCLEGMPKPQEGQSHARYEAFNESAKQIGINLIEFDVPPSTKYHDESLFFQQLIAVFRLNHLLPPI
ncbi:DUF7147 family protein [Alkalibacillus almallahensis]|uniref:DUF7147 family protein n=1 Tax=Alkalibacillus almallahensis TaxID=1379154 RepID=UPI0014229796|nr:methylthioribose kinase [Alkalibacillus almallahensis]NIK10674.1 hypothetical protein [Alkalibacillus almallahensis]